jgi:hypothetical protein
VSSSPTTLPLRRACWIGLFYAACSGESGGLDPLPAQIRPEPELVWQSASVPLDPDGRSEPWTFPVPDGPRAFAVRSALEPAADGDRTCFQLEDVTLASGETWVGDATSEDLGDYCVTCRERVAVGAGYGYAVLPSGAEDARDLGSVSLRVVLRDCATLTPLSAAEAGAQQLHVEQSSWQPPRDAERLSLPFTVLVATRAGFAGDDMLLPLALSALRRTWSAAGIELVSTAQLTLDAPASPIEYAPDDRGPLIALARAAHRALDAQRVSRAWPAFVFTPCLRRQDPIAHGRSEPLAFTPHVPGGFGLGDEPDLIFVAAERCEGLTAGPRFLDPETLGAVLAHELGHYFGLFHVLEQDGRADNLSDTSPDRLNLMQAMPSPDALTLTDSQIHVARRHPIFADYSR